MTGVRVKACAKVNLFLEITGKRPDGYHTLSTIFQTISLADELTFTPSDHPAFTCSDARLPVGDGNLACKAARILADSIPDAKRVAIHLEKNIPMGAGLGGGSSDAAAVLRTLSKDPFPAFAARLGADVPFFLKGGTCAAGGIGDELRPLPPLPKTWLVLVYPGFGVSTKDAYAKVRLPFARSMSLQTIESALALKEPEAWAGELFNRFEEVVFPHYPDLPRIKRELVEAGALNSLMSGSGSTVFGVMRNESEGRNALSALRPKYPQSWLVHTL